MQNVEDVFLWIITRIGVAIVPLAVFLYLVIVHGGLFFSPRGRINRLSYWEGLSAWVLLNIFTVMFIIIYMMYSTRFLINTLADKTQGDADYTIYTKLFFAVFCLQWIFAMATLVPICAKRWHDLNLPGALAAVNAAPVAVAGLVLLSFFAEIGQVLFQRVVTDSNVFGPGNNAFTMLDQAKELYFKEYISPHSMYYCFTAAVIGGAFLYLGLSPSAIGASGSRKKSVNVSPRPSRA